MNPKLIFLAEFLKLLGRLSDAALRNDSQSFLGLIKSIRAICDESEKSLRFRVIDYSDVDDEEL